MSTPPNTLGASFDVIVEIPELDGHSLLPTTSVELSALDTAVPRLVLGGRVTLHGQHQDLIGSVLVAGFAPPSSPVAVVAAALATKRITFVVVSGVLADLCETG